MNLSSIKIAGLLAVSVLVEIGFTTIARAVLRLSILSVHCERYMGAVNGVSAVGIVHWDSLEKGSESVEL